MRPMQGFPKPLPSCPSAGPPPSWSIPMEATSGSVVRRQPALPVWGQTCPRSQLVQTEERRAEGQAQAPGGLAALCPHSHPDLPRAGKAARMSTLGTYPKIHHHFGTVAPRRAPDSEVGRQEGRRPNGAVAEGQAGAPLRSLAPPELSALALAAVFRSASPPLPPASRPVLSRSSPPALSSPGSSQTPLGACSPRAGPSAGALLTLPVPALLPGSLRRAELLIPTPSAPHAGHRGPHGVGGPQGRGPGRQPLPA